VVRLFAAVMPSIITILRPVSAPFAPHIAAGVGCYARAGLMSWCGCSLVGGPRACQWLVVLPPPSTEAQHGSNCRLSAVMSRVAPSKAMWAIAPKPVAGLHMPMVGPHAAAHVDPWHVV
jgi:hypothetical protein